jgi:hypothetical protein
MRAFGPLVAAGDYGGIAALRNCPAARNPEYLPTGQWSAIVAAEIRRS